MVPVVLVVLVVLNIIAPITYFPIYTDIDTACTPCSFQLYFIFNHTTRALEQVSS